MSKSLNPAQTPSRGRVWLYIAILIVVYPVVFSLPCFVLLPRVLAPAFNPRGIAAAMFGAMVVSELIMLGVLVAMLRREGRSLADLGWRRPTTWYALLLSVLLGLALGAVPYFAPSVPGFTSALTETSLLRAWAVVVTVFAAFVEETIFRGFIMTEVQRIRVPVLLQIVVSAFGWALYHAIPGGLPAMAYSIVYGVIFAGLYLVGKRSLTPPLTVHGLLNLVSEPQGVLNLLSFLLRR